VNFHCGIASCFVACVVVRDLPEGQRFTDPDFNFFSVEKDIVLKAGNQRFVFSILQSYRNSKTAKRIVL